jgi:hypothetical protein
MQREPLLFLAARLCACTHYRRQLIDANNIMVEFGGNAVSGGKTVRCR